MRSFLFFIALIASGDANPLFNGADPHAMAIDGSYWIFPTGSRDHRPVFTAWKSQDLLHWDQAAVLLDLDEVPWVKADGRPRYAAWAPSMLVKNGRYYFYYSVGPQSKDHPSLIGVATSASLTGPFQDSGKPLIVGGSEFEAIDPMTFIDPPSGKAYLYAGGSAAAKLRVFELNPDLTSVAHEVPAPQPEHFTEGVFMHRRGNGYYLSYSHGNWNDSSYSVHYSTSASPVGPWTYRGCILKSDATHQGPGHHSFFVDPASGNTFIAYHRWDTSEPRGPYKGSRKIAIEKISYDARGLILPITMTD